MIWPFPFGRRKPRRIEVDNLAAFIKSAHIATVDEKRVTPKPNNGFPHRISARINIAGPMVWSHLATKDMHRIEDVIARTGKPHIKVLGGTEKGERVFGAFYREFSERELDHIKAGRPPNHVDLATGTDYSCGFITKFNPRTGHRSGR